MSEDISEILENNWDSLKAEIKNKWCKLTNEDIDEISGSYEKLMEKVKEIYGENEDQFKESMHAICEKLELLKDQAMTAKEKMEKTLHVSFDEIKEKAIELQECVVNYVKQHPVKTIGAVLLGALLLPKLFRK